ncbi:MAG: universal stress protein [Pseudonocardia sp.]|nr:universal stress protein [Pseudonocardia sp.]
MRHGPDRHRNAVRASLAGRRGAEAGAWAGGPVVMVTGSAATSPSVARWAADEATLRAASLLISVTDAVDPCAEGTAFASAMTLVRAHAPAVAAHAVPARTYGADPAELSADAALVVVAADAPGTPTLAAEADCPVVAVPDGYLTTDRSAPVLLGVAPWTAEVAIDLAFDEAELRQTALDAVRIWFDRDVDLGVPSDRGLARFDAECDQASRELDYALSAWSSRHPTVDVRHIVIEDSTVPALVAFSHRSQLLVLGRSAHGLDEARRLGSPLEPLIASTRCPVLVVPGGGPRRGRWLPGEGITE